MQDIGKVLRRKRIQYAQLGKEIELLQQAEEKLREVAALLADNDEEESVVLAEVDEDMGHTAGANAKSAAAGVQSSMSQTSTSQADPSKPVALRWP